MSKRSEDFDRITSAEGEAAAMRTQCVVQPSSCAT